MIAPAVDGVLLVVRAGKGEKARVLPLTRSAFARLQDYMAQARPRLLSAHVDSDRALLLSNRGRRIDGNHLLRLLRRPRRPNPLPLTRHRRGRRSRSRAGRGSSSTTC